MNRKGIVLILSFFVIMILTVLAGALLTKSINENNLAQRHLNSVRAFWLAEEGVAEALARLPATAVLSGCLPAARGCPQGNTCCYAVTIGAPANSYYPIQSSGTVTLASGATITNTVDAVASCQLLGMPTLEHAIEVSGDLITKGSAYTIDGTINEGASLSFSDLFGQTKEEVKASSDHLYADVLTEPIDGITWVDVSEGSELAVASDLQGTGILIISGDVHFSGTVNFEGILYIIGKLEISGTPTFSGTVLAESGADIDTTIKGNVTINYDLDAINGALIYIYPPTSRIVSWRQTL